jgi:hypothetical protein
MFLGLNMDSSYILRGSHAPSSVSREGWLDLTPETREADGGHAPETLTKTFGTAK